MAYIHYIGLAYLLIAFIAVDALKIKSREENLRPYSSETQPSFLKRLQELGDSELEIPALLQLYELEKRGMMPYSGGIFGR